MLVVGAVSAWEASRSRTLCSVECDSSTACAVLWVKLLALALLLSFRLLCASPLV